eukprot:11298-Heterococcus_DN1.PRE.1
MSTQDDNSGISLDSDPQDKQHHLDDDSVTVCDHREQRQHDDDDDTDASDVISAKGKELVQSQKGTKQAYMSTYAANTSCSLVASSTAVVVQPTWWPTLCVQCISKQCTCTAQCYELAMICSIMT